jgi:hypothetical protein
LTSYFKFILQKYQVVLDFWPLFAWPVSLLYLLVFILEPKG